MTTEKMFPSGFVPEKDGAEVYRHLYSDPEFTLEDKINSIELSSLSEAAVLTLCKRNRHETGVGIENPEWLEPVNQRYILTQISIRFGLQNLRACEIRFREAIGDNEDDLPAAYKALRTTFITVVGQKVAMEYVKHQLAGTTPEELERQKFAYEAKEKALKEKLERRKKIYAIAKEHPDFVDDMRFDEAYYIEEYKLTEADLEELDEMLEEERQEELKRANIPWDHTERYDWRDGYYSVPILTEKIKMVRKAEKINQRDFAKLIGYPNVNKYAKLEKGDLGSPTYPEKINLIKDVSDATGANPYWLEEDKEETLYEADQEQTAKTASEARTFYSWPMYATSKVIREWWVQRKKDLQSHF